jgi:hypothetical protein
MGRDVEGSGSATFQTTVLTFAGNVEECHGKYQSRQENEGSRIESETFSIQRYRGADKSLAQPGKKQATATEVFDVHMSYL